MADDCLFCKIVAGEIPSKKVYEDEVCYAFDDIEPEAPVHTLVVPKKHYENLNDNPDPELLGVICFPWCPRSQRSKACMIPATA